MLAIKLKRIGKRHQATYRVIVSERRKKIEGRSVEDLGWLDPHTNKFSLNSEATKKWLSVGAQPTDTVRNLLIRAKIITDTKKVPLHLKPKKKEKAK